MRKLLVIAIVALHLPGCNSLKSYSGACYRDGSAYDGKEYLSVECKNYCSIILSGVCKNTVTELSRAEEEWSKDLGKRQSEEFENNANKLKVERESQLEQDKQLCSSFGFTDKTDGMAQCLMKQHDKRNLDEKASFEASMQQKKEQKRRAVATSIARENAEHQAELQRQANTQQFIQRQHERNDQFLRDLQRNSNQQIQQMNQIRQSGYETTPLKNIDQTCLRNCQQTGYQYDFCQSKCSY